MTVRVGFLGGGFIANHHGKMLHTSGADAAIVAVHDPDSAKAAEGTIRKAFGTSIEKNAVHGSDAQETAAQEIAFFFSGAELASTARG